MSEASGYPEFMMRVILPPSHSFHSSPSGDTEYDIAYNKALMENKPAGFEVIYPRRNEKWPVDSEGYTWVRLQCTNKEDALAYWRLCG